MPQKNQGPQGKPVTPVASSLDFLPEAAPAPQVQRQEESLRAPVDDAAPTLQIDSPEYAALIKECLDQQPDIVQVIEKMASVKQAVTSGHDVKVAIVAMTEIVSQLAAVVAVKHAFVSTQVDGGGVDLEDMEALSEIHGEIRELVNSSTIMAATKDKIKKLLDEADEILDEYLGEEEDD